MNTRHWAICAALTLFVVFPSSAKAFCRTTTVPSAADFNPKPGKCWDQGIPLWWKNACVGYSVHDPPSRFVAYNDATKALATSDGLHAVEWRLLSNQRRGTLSAERRRPRFGPRLLRGGCVKESGSEPERDHFSRR